MKKIKRIVNYYAAFLLLGAGLLACTEEKDITPTPPVNPGNPTAEPFDINQLKDTYAEIAPYEFRFKWGPYNVHDPSVIKEGEYYHCYGTDVGYGTTVPPGVQIRKSKDLINWEYVGTAFNGLPAQGADFIRQGGGTPFNSLWAPYVLKAGNEFRLYYSLSSPTLRLSVIGLATATSPTGPWVEKGLVVTSLNDARIQTNAIDPTVVIAPSGNHYFYYGSAWDGIYMLKLNPATGLAAVNGDKGKRIAQRGFTGNMVNGNIEGPEIIYNQELNKYYLFISYDWLETKYNVRVGRADSPEGPFLDFNGKDLNTEEDNGPMILAPYQFAGHGGWQGVSHPAVFKDNGHYYMAHQGRPGVDKYFMVLHVRKMFWTADGWPVVSPERYAGTEQTPVTQTDLVGAWEQITLNYSVVSGYAIEQTSPNFQVSVPLQLNDNGTLNADATGKWTYQAPWLQIEWSNGQTAKLYVERGRDWENKKPCLIFTGLNQAGTAIWGKKTL